MNGLDSHTLMTAIMVDGGFYQKRAKTLWGEKTPKERASELVRYCNLHITQTKELRFLYRIFYYDCPPLGKKLRHPLTNAEIDLSKTPLYGWMTDFHEALRNKRKLALRFGQLSEKRAHYSISPEAVKKLCNKTIDIERLTEADFIMNVEQKGVDMKIGLDIASLAYKGKVDQIILISGDSDFVPAAKHARREGIDFILDPMWADIKPDLNEHIDGLHSFRNASKPKYRVKKTSVIEDIDPK